MHFHEAMGKESFEVRETAQKFVSPFRMSRIIPHVL